MKTEENLFKNEGYQFMGAAFEVYNELGHGLLEEIYQESLELELGIRGIPYTSHQELRSFYKGFELKKRYIQDLIVFGGLMIEIKAVSKLLPEHEAQLINYMRLTRNKAGYLVNFGSKEHLEWKRFVLSEAGVRNQQLAEISVH